MADAEHVAAACGSLGQEPFQALFEASPALYLALNPSLEIIAVSDMYLSATMTRRSQLVGRHLFDAFPDIPSELEATITRNLRESLNRVLANATPDRMPVQRYDIRRPDGTFDERYWSPLNTPVLTPAGCVRYIIHQVTDVTETIRLEHASPRHDVEELVASHAGEEATGATLDTKERMRGENARLELAATVEQQARIFDATLAAINDFVYIFDREGRFLFANQPLLRLWGLTLSEATGKNFFDLGYPDALAAKLQRQIAEVFATGQVLTDETPYTNPAGVEGCYEYIFSPVRADDGTIEVVAGTTREITARKAVEYRMRGLLTAQQALHEQNARLVEIERGARTEAERHSRMKDEFLATVSHELRTPLNNILGWAELLHTAASREEAAEGLATIERNARLQAKTVAGLLDLNRMMSGKIELSVASIRLDVLLSEAVRSLYPASVALGVRLTSSLESASVNLNGDPQRLHQVFSNVIGNALKFTPRGGSVHVGAELRESMVEVRVTDTGEGIAPEFLPHVFERFRAADARITRGHGGLGIGLSIARELVELHGGTITASSPGENLGAEFTLSLPHSNRPGG